MKVLEQLMTKTMTNTYVVIFFCRLHFSLAVIIPDIYILYIEFTGCALCVVPAVVNHVID